MVEVHTLADAMHGFEQQLVTLSASKGNISGTFRLEFDGSLTPEMSVHVAAHELEVALEGLPRLGDVRVYKQTQSHGYKFVVIFLQQLGNIENLVISSTYLSSSDSSAELTALVTQLVMGRTPMFDTPLYGYMDVEPHSPETSSVPYISPQLLSGYRYHVKVSAWNGFGDAFGRAKHGYPASLPVGPRASSPMDIIVSAKNETALQAAWKPVLDTRSFS